MPSIKAYFPVLDDVVEYDSFQFIRSFTGTFKNSCFCVSQKMTAVKINKSQWLARAEFGFSEVPFAQFDPRVPDLLFSIPFFIGKEASSQGMRSQERARLKAVFENTDSGYSQPRPDPPTHLFVKLLHLASSFRFIFFLILLASILKPGIYP